MTNSVCAKGGGGVELEQAGVREEEDHGVLSADDGVRCSGSGGVEGEGGCACHDTVLVFRLLFPQQLRTLSSACELFSVSISVSVFL